MTGPPLARTPIASNRARSHERALYGATALLFATIVFIGFSRSYYLGPFLGAPPLPSTMVHLHGLVMSAWVTLFVTQVWLVSSRRVRLHQRIGLAGAALGILVVVVGAWTALLAAKHGSTSTPEGFSQPTFSIVPLGDLVLFVLFFGGALYYRRNPVTHKRLMLLTVLNFLPPAIGRLPLGFVHTAPVASILGTIVVALVCSVVFDLWHYRRVNRVFVAGGLLLVASFPIRIALIGTAWWVHSATWLASLV
jgi:hypothetical protein